jgi:hypothetical protein
LVLLPRERIPILFGTLKWDLVLEKKIGLLWGILLMTYLEHCIVFVKLHESTYVITHFKLTFVREYIICVGIIKLWGAFKIIEPPIMYNLLSWSVKDVFCLVFMGNKSISHGEWVGSQMKLLQNDQLSSMRVNFKWSNPWWPII